MEHFPSEIIDMIIPDPHVAAALERTCRRVYERYAATFDYRVYTGQRPLLAEYPAKMYRMHAPADFYAARNVECLARWWHKSKMTKIMSFVRWFLLCKSGPHNITFTPRSNLI